jgi:mevalonate kinase
VVLVVAEAGTEKKSFVHSAVATSVEASACGKVILVGEHAVVYGARALAIPVPNLRFHLNWRRLASSDQHKAKFRLVSGATSDQLAGVIDDACKELGLDSFNVDVHGHSDLPLGAGLGSSAALCIAMLRAAALERGQILPPAQLAMLGNRLERRFHGNPSGLDTAVVAHEQPIVFRKGEGAKPMTLGANRLQFALVDTGVRSSTLKMIEIAAPAFRGAAGERRVQAFEDMVTAAEQAVAQGVVADLGAAMTVAHRLLCEIGAVSDGLADLVTKCTDAGVLGAKFTGAGGGGCILCLLDPEKAQSQVNALRQTFSHVMTVEL